MEFVVAGISQQDPKTWSQGEKNLSCCIHPNLKNIEGQEEKCHETDWMSLAYSEYHLGLQKDVLLVFLCPSPGLTDTLLRELLKYEGLL